MLAPPEALTEVVGFLSSVDAEPAPEESFDDDSVGDDESGVDDASDVDDVPSDSDADEVPGDFGDSDESDDESDEDESEEGSATATQGSATTAVPIPSATASAPTLPMYFAFPISVPVDAVVRAPDSAVEQLDSAGLATDPN